MSLVDFFDAARALKRELTGETLSQADVDALNAVITPWNAPQSPPDAPQSAIQDSGLCWGAKVSQTFRDRVLWIAGQLGISADDLMACMAWESGRTFSPSIRNMAGSGAVGLIQFMPATAASLGTSPDALAAMTAEDQLNYVYKYFAPWKGRLQNLADLYMAILWPAGVGKPMDYQLWNQATRPTTYRQNIGLDTNRDGSITKAEVSAKLYAIRAEGLQSGNAA